ncbi:MAG: IS200/IS605 family transposase, partial [Phycisphaerae bacterium]
MRDWESLSHVRWDCKFHVVIVPKYRKRKIYGRVRSRLGQILRDLAKQKDVDVVEGSPKSDHVHMCLKIPPKYSVAHTIGFL